MERISMKAARVNIGMTQEELASAVNVTKKTVGSWENGKTRPPIDKVEAICKVLNRPYDGIRWNF